MVVAVQQAAFTSASTVYEALKRAAKAVNPAANARTGYPSRNQVKDVLTTIDIAQTTKPYKLNPAEFDTIVSRNRGAGRQGGGDIKCNWILLFSTGGGRATGLDRQTARATRSCTGRCSSMSTLDW